MYGLVHLRADLEGSPPPRFARIVPCPYAVHTSALCATCWRQSVWPSHFILGWSDHGVRLPVRPDTNPPLSPPTLDPPTHTS